MLPDHRLDYLGYEGEASGSGAGTVKVWDAATGELPGALFFVLPPTDTQVRDGDRCELLIVNKLTDVYALVAPPTVYELTGFPAGLAREV